MFLYKDGDIQDNDDWFFSPLLLLNPKQGNKQKIFVSKYFCLSLNFCVIGNNFTIIQNRKSSKIIE